jgi:hypothetical protein
MAPNADFSSVWNQFVNSTIHWPYQHQYGVIVNGSAVTELHCQSLGITPADIDRDSYMRRAKQICGLQQTGNVQIIYEAEQLILRANNNDVLDEIPAAIDLSGIEHTFETVVGLVNERMLPDHILVEQSSKQSWLVDFSQISPQAPMLLPFARLELELKCDLLEQAGADVAERYQVELALGRMQSLTARVDETGVPAHLHKLLSSIQDIRQRAAELTRGQTIRAYQTSLLLASLAQLASCDNPDLARVGEQPLRCASMLLSAALAYQALRPSHPSRQGLWFDPKQQLLWLDDELVKLATGDYELVVYLAQTPGAPRSYWSIACDLLDRSLPNMLRGWEEQGLDQQEIEEKKRLFIQKKKATIEARVFRIRRALNDSPPSRYLINERSVGLSLHLTGVL